MSKLVKFENYLKDVQANNADEFPDISEIMRLYVRLDDANKNLSQRKAISEQEMDNTAGQMDLFIKQ